MVRRRKKDPGGSNLIRFPGARHPVVTTPLTEEIPSAKIVIPAEGEDPAKTFKRLMKKKDYANAAGFAREHNMAGDAKRAARLWIAKLIEDEPREAVGFAMESGLSDEFGISLKRMLENLIRAGEAWFENARIIADFYPLCRPLILPNETVPINLKQIAGSVAEEYEDEGKELEAARIRKEFGV